MNLKHTNQISLSHAYDLATKSNTKTKNIIVINNNNTANKNGMNDHFLSENVNFNYPQYQPVFDKKMTAEYSNSCNFILNYFDCYRILIVYPQFNSKVNYYHEFWKMYLQNEVLISQMKEYVTQTKDIQTRINELEVLYYLCKYIILFKKSKSVCEELELNLLNNLKKESKKKNRRTSNEIEKSHIVNIFCIYIIYILLLVSL